MIIYFDTSALVKLYVKEKNSAQVESLVESGEITAGSTVITQVEMASALQRSVASTSKPSEAFNENWLEFINDWQSFVRFQVNDDTIEKASQLAWTYKLRGYDSLHLAAALLWREAVNESITLATFDRELWAAAKKAGLEAWPEGLVEME